MIAWWKLFGFPWDPRLWIAFVVHDWGYWGKPDMDGEEGESHPHLGASIMGVFDAHWHGWYGWKHLFLANACNRMFGDGAPGWDFEEHEKRTWYCFAFYHSRFMAKRYGMWHSKLCVADKLALCLEPWWIYLPRVILTGEVKEYMAHRLTTSKYANEPLTAQERDELSRATRRSWFRGMTSYLRRWVEEHKDGRQDDWT